MCPGRALGPNPSQKRIINPSSEIKIRGV
jgi:hypothetical protein